MIGPAGVGKKRVRLGISPWPPEHSLMLITQATEENPLKDVYQIRGGLGKKKETA